MVTLEKWFNQPSPPIVSDYNPPSITVGLMGVTAPDTNGQPNAVGSPMPQLLYDLASYYTPFRALWRRPRNVVTGQ